MYQVSEETENKRKYLNMAKYFALRALTWLNEKKDENYSLNLFEGSAGTLISLFTVKELLENDLQGNEKNNDKTVMVPGIDLLF